MSVESMIGSATGSVERMTSTRDATGGTTNEWNTAYEDVPMRDEITGSHDDYRGGKRVMVTNHRIYTQQSGISIGMRIVISGLKMLVLGTTPRYARSIAIPTWYEIDCEQESEMPAQ